MYLNLVSFLHFLRLSLESESQGLRTWWAAVSGVAQSRTRLKRLSNSSSRLSLPPTTFLLPPSWFKLFHSDYKAVITKDCIPHVVAVQSLSHVWFFATSCTVAQLASLSFTVSQNLLRFMPFVSVMLANHLILCCHLCLCLQSFPASPLYSENLWQTPTTKGGNSKIFWLYVTRHQNTEPLCLVILIFHTFEVYPLFNFHLPASLTSLFSSLVIWFTVFSQYTILISLHLLTV